MTELIAIFTLIGVIIFLLGDKYFHTESESRHIEKLLEENSRLVKALISKNANEYVMTASIDKVAPETKPPSNPDLIPEEALSDDEFFDAIGQGLKDKEKN